MRLLLIAILLLAACAPAPTIDIPTLAVIAPNVTVAISTDASSRDAINGVPTVVIPTTTPTASPTPSATPSSTPTPTETPIYAELGTFLGAIIPGQRIVGRFNAVGERYVYLIDGRAGQYVSLRLQPQVVGSDPALTFYDPSGAALATDEDSGGLDTPLLTVQLPVDGVYSLQAREDNNPGGYTLELQQFDAAPPPRVVPFVPTATPPFVLSLPTPDATITTLTPYAPLIGRVERPGDFARLTLNARTGDALTIGVTPLPGSILRTTLEVFDPDGVALVQISADASGVALVPRLDALMTGEYSLFVTGADNTGGAFVISYGLDGAYSELFRAVLPPDVPGQGQLATRGLRDVWAVYLNAGDVITAGVTSGTRDFDAALALIAPDGTQVAFSDDAPNGGDPLIGSAAASVSGVYLFQVTGEDAASAGAYTLLWRYLIAAPTPTLPPSRAPILRADGELVAGETRAYVFQGMAGQQVRIGVTATSGGLDPLAVLLAPDGAIIAQGDDSDGSLNPRFDATLPADGTYTLQLRGYGDTAGGFTAAVDLLVG
jgi:hypothetical protein